MKKMNVFAKNIPKAPEEIKTNPAIRTFLKPRMSIILFKTIAVIKTAIKDNEMAAPILSRPIYKSFAIIGIRGPTSPAEIPSIILWASE
jgi:hypothetical protein